MITFNIVLKKKVHTVFRQFKRVSLRSTCNDFVVCNNKDIHPFHHNHYSPTESSTSSFIISSNIRWYSAANFSSWAFIYLM